MFQRSRRRAGGLGTRHDKQQRLVQVEKSDDNGDKRRASPLNPHSGLLQICSLRKKSGFFLSATVTATEIPSPPSAASAAATAAPTFTATTWTLVHKPPLTGLPQRYNKHIQTILPCIHLFITHMHTQTGTRAIRNRSGECCNEGVTTSVQEMRCPPACGCPTKSKRSSTASWNICLVRWVS